MNWKQAKDNLPIKGKYLVTVNTDEGLTTDILEFDGKNWIIDGEPTFCTPYYYEVLAYKNIPSPANLSKLNITLED